MRHSNTVLFLMSIFFFVHCAQDSANEFPFAFNKKYNFQMGEGSKHYTPELAKTITFFENGTYSRTEDCGYIGMIDIENGITIVIIDEMRGTWNQEGGFLFLSDVSVEEYHCRTKDGRIEKCIPKDHIPFGLSEWFRSSKVMAETEDYLLIERQKSKH
ncbi:MAG: hypothetical protein P1U56_11860 [Saprospiraceae bacterium]|nr:hypothetical protein [Saprospiraceae bacterium]